MTRILTFLGLVTVLVAIGGSTVSTNSAPEGFAQLFNGYDLTGWKDDRSGHWRAVQGLLFYDGGGWQPAPSTEFKRNLCTESEYGDFILLIDWKIEKDGNSGIFLRGDLSQSESGQVQVEIWDRTAVVYSSPLGSGGIVGYTVKEQAPLRTVDRPVGEWNHFEIRVEKGRVTVYLNDQLVLDKFQAKFKKPKGPIVLQHHGSPLWFRNIYIKELAQQQ